MRGVLVGGNRAGGAKETDESQEIYERGKREFKRSAATSMSYSIVIFSDERVKNRRDLAQQCVNPRRRSTNAQRASHQRWRRVGCDEGKWSLRLRARRFFSALRSRANIAQL